MKKLELKQALKPLIKECIKEIIFEEGILSSLITEVARGLGSPPTSSPPPIPVIQNLPNRSESVLEAKKQLNEVKAQLSKASGLTRNF